MDGPLAYSHMNDKFEWTSSSNKNYKNNLLEMKKIPRLSLKNKTLNRSEDVMRKS